MARRDAEDGKGDQVFRHWQYKPVCNHAPTCASKCVAVTWMWTKKEAVHH